MEKMWQVRFRLHGVELTYKTMAGNGQAAKTIVEENYLGADVHSWKCLNQEVREYDSTAFVVKLTPTHYDNYPLDPANITGYVTPEGEVVGWANWSGYVYPRQVQFREAVNHSFAIVLSPAAWEERFVALRDAVDLARYRREEAAQRERKERWETPTVVTPDTPRTIDLGCGHRVVVSLGNTYVQGSPGAKIIFVREGLPPVVVGPLRDRTGEISDMHQPDMCHNWIRLRRPYGAADTDPVSVPEECGCHSSTLGLSFMER